jgi:hypothetical protein
MHRLKGKQVPFGYEEVKAGYVVPLPQELEALRIAINHMEKGEFSQREAASWLSSITQRDISHKGLAKRAKLGVRLYEELG